MKKIGWIGTGVMGHAMIQHIMQAGYETYVYNRTSSKTEYLQEQGAIACNSIAELTQKVDIVFSIIGDPQNVRDSYLGEQGILKNAREGMILIDMTTTQPALAREIYEQAQKMKIQTLDAPVSGGDIGAINGSLSIMVGGNEETYQEILPFFDLMGKSITYIGDAGRGQSTKMANQIGAAGNMIGMCESLLYAERSGLDIETTISVLRAGVANSWGMQNLADRIVKSDFESCFFVKHFVKDMRIALDECRRMNLTLPGLSLVHDLYSFMLAHGESDYGLQALIISLKRMNNISLDSK